jgi:two-component system, chemotaxis family, protein-glutamate methylesterase/glutaminase
MGLAVPSVPSAIATADPAIRVMVVDDSVVVRGLVARWIEEEPGLVVAASLRNGRDAVDQLERVDPDVVILDVEMPELDGISALPLLLAKKRDLVVIMASTLTRHNAEISLKALSLGAADYIPKPETNRGVTTSATFRRELIEKIRELGARRRRRRPAARGAPAPAPPPAQRAAESAAPIKLRPFAPTAPRVLVIGSSTGGPQALTSLVSNLRGLLARVPVLITQHMPPTFTTILAEHIARAAGSAAHEGVDREPVRPGTIYVAPGGKHMQAVRRDNGVFIALDDGPSVNYCKPAVDPLFRSAAAAWGPGALALILTGMGSDGAKGGAEIVAQGGSVIAQDEATSVVWGMPAAAAHAGICSAVLPLDQIAPKIMRLFSGERS